MKKNSVALTGMGLSALLAMFAVLTLAVLALLSVSTAKAQQRLGEKTREPVFAYYLAEEDAHEILARLRTGEVPQNVSRENGLYCYRCPVGKDQYLAVEVEIRGSAYRIARWQVCSASGWEADDTLPVWEGKKE